MSLIGVLLETFERLNSCEDPRKDGPVIKNLRKEIQRAIDLSLLPSEKILKPKPSEPSINPTRRLELVSRKDVQ